MEESLTAQDCNPSYSRGCFGKPLRSRPTLAKFYVHPLTLQTKQNINQKKGGKEKKKRRKEKKGRLTLKQLTIKVKCRSKE